MEKLWSTYSVRETYCPEVDVYDDQGNFLVKAPPWLSYMWTYELSDRAVIRQDIHMDGKIDQYIRCEWKNPDGSYYRDDVDTFDLRLTEHVWKKEFLDKSRYN